MSDFKAAIREVEPSALREIYVEILEITWEEVGGLEEIKDRLKESVEWPLTKPELFEHFGIKPPRGIVLFGAPGTGRPSSPRRLPMRPKPTSSRSRVLSDLEVGR